jgi:hypothetical protein
LKVMPSTIDTIASSTVAPRATSNCSRSVGLAAPHDVDPQVVRERGRARQREPATTARIVANATAR